MGFIKDIRMKQELELYLGDRDRSLFNQRKKIKVRSYLTLSLIIFVALFCIIKFGISQVSIIISLILLFAGIVYEASKYYCELKTETEIEVEKKKINSFEEIKLNANENIEKEKITHVVLKDDEGHEIKTWKLDDFSSLIIGKENPQNHVEIDLSNVMYSALISRKHGILNKSDSVWYYEDLNSLNGSMIEKRENGEKVKISRGSSIKVESGDYLYISNTKLLLI